MLRSEVDCYLCYGYLNKRCWAPLVIDGDWQAVCDKCFEYIEWTISDADILLLTHAVFRSENGAMLPPDFCQQHVCISFVVNGENANFYAYLAHNECVIALKGKYYSRLLCGYQQCIPPDAYRLSKAGRRKREESVRRNIRYRIEKNRRDQRYIERMWQTDILYLMLLHLKPIVGKDVAQMIVKMAKRLNETIK